MKVSAIRQSVVIPATPDEVYVALMDGGKHSQFTGSPARVSPRVGGSFSAYDGYASGKNIELSPGRKIVQSWRAGDWPEGHYSKITIVLEKKGGSTRLDFVQEGVPVGFSGDVAQGWKDFYWAPLKKMFARL